VTFLQNVPLETAKHDMFFMRRKFFFYLQRALWSFLFARLWGKISISFKFKGNINTQPTNLF